MLQGQDVTGTFSAFEGCKRSNECYNFSVTQSFGGDLLRIKIARKFAVVARAKSVVCSQSRL